MKTLALLAPILLLGCVDSGDDAAPSDDGADIHPDFSSVGEHTYECTAAECIVDLGTSVDRTCFLAGITGDLQTASDAPRGAMALIDSTTGDYTVRLFGSTAQPIGATFTCVNSATNRVTGNWYTGAIPVVMAGTSSAARRCFLTEVVGTSSTSFTHFTDSVQVAPNSYGEWNLYGNQVSGSSVNAGAVCIDVTPDGTWAYNNGQIGSVSGNISADTGGVACGLSALNGEFNDGFENGVWITHNGGTYPQWGWQFGSYEGGAAYCVE
jgi:hypothetical protein